MYISLVWAITGLCIFTTYKFLLWCVNERRIRANMRQLGSQRPMMLREGDFFSLGNLRNLMRADKGYYLPYYLYDRTVGRMDAWAHKPATFYQFLFGAKLIFTVDPKNVQTILATKFKDFELGEVRRKSFFPLLERGIFANDGKEWEHSRALLRPQFVRDQVSDLELEERHVQNMLQALPVNPDGWTDVTDMKTLFFRLTLDTATEFLFGETVGSQLANLPGPLAKFSPVAFNEGDFATSFDRAQRYMSKAMRLDTLWWMAYDDEFRKECRTCHGFLDHYINRALAQKKNPPTIKEPQTTTEGTGPSKPKYVFLSALAETTDNPAELRQELLNILLAGRDTTASLLSFLFIELAKQPSVFRRLRALVLDDFGSYDHPRDVSFARLKSCSYLQWCLNETLRLHPIVPVNSRRAVRDTSLPTGGGPDGTAPVYVRKGMAVEYSVYIMHRLRDYWGEDADVFRPERWDGKRQGFEYLPFNGGPRICIGQQFALTEAGYVVVRLLQRFEEVVGVGNTWQSKETGGLGWLRYGLTLTMSPADGVKLRFKEAKQ
ncbi:cytochrome P450 52A12 [Aaosphaeria arxii CBS 175.79]|uniref:Cytochrome P450 52A12 n=1 Tax=Aaosphaeria arxii CBS 175.79 TaxID=1450172 RepID=A0A6A5XZQ1_9PLEO|nr:cytochrome P450 52A12 [Aaosphaeria arxii CBS 175.79]KAF2018436.1 cytochrome P450 52A12 [Aaosphaeria arxii CBS 175.79]